MNQPTHWKDPFAAGAALAEDKSFHIEGVPAVLIPEGYQVDTYPDLMPHPLRIEKTVTTHTAEAFLTYWNRFADKDSTVFFDLRAGKFLGILDYHRQDTADWCAHAVNYACPETPEWKKWKDNNGKPMSQKDFALFIEDAVPDFIAPTGADMLEIATTLEAKRGVTFKSGIRLNNNVAELSYIESADDTAGAKGQLKIPQTIKIGVRLFEGGEGYEVEAHFRYHIVKDGGLQMWYDLVRPHKVHEAAISEIYEAIAIGMGAGQILRGWPA